MVIEVCSGSSGGSSSGGGGFSGSSDSSGSNSRGSNSGSAVVVDVVGIDQGYCYHCYCVGYPFNYIHTSLHITNRIKVMLQTKHGVIPEFKWSILSRGAGTLTDPISYIVLIFTTFTMCMW